MTQIAVRPIEGSAIIITVSFTGPDGIGFTPNTCAWSLTTPKGVVINSRDRVAVTVSGTSYNFMVAGDDLLSADGDKRVFTVEGEYDCTYGNNVPYRAEASFSIDDTVVKPA